MTQKNDVSRQARRGWNAHNLPELARSVVLIGLMGSGKTSVGHRLAAILGTDLVDSDAEIEAAAGMQIPDIFDTYGEAHFRDGERKVLARLLSGPACVIASGGGAYMDPQTRAVISTGGVSVWIKADLDLLVYRTAGRTHRPLLNKGNPRKILANLIEERHPVYAEADLMVESKPGQSHEQMAKRIVDVLVSDGTAFSGANP